MDEPLTAATVSITCYGGDEIEAYLARPLGQRPFGGVVVIHHMPGYDSATKEITRKFAAHGHGSASRRSRAGTGQCNTTRGQSEHSMRCERVRSWLRGGERSCRRSCC